MSDSSFIHLLPPCSRGYARACHPHLRAFSIVEVMFAIMILGIGFIMVAAIFPVGIQQGRDAVDETTGKTIAREAANRAASVMRIIADDPNTTQRDANLTAMVTPGTAYVWVDPTDTSAQVAIGTTSIGAGSYGGGSIYYRQQMGADWQYQGGRDYLSQVLYRTTFAAGPPANGRLYITALALRDTRAPADQGTVLGAPYVQTCEICTDSKTNIYSDLYIRNAGAMGSDQTQITNYLGTRGTIVLSDGRVITMSDNAPTLQFGPPPAGASAWQPAWLIRTDVPVIGSFKLETSLP